MVNVKVYNKKNKHHWLHLKLNSALRPISHNSQIPSPTLTHLPELKEEGFFSSLDLSHGEEDIDFHSENYLLDKPMLFNQLELNDLVRVLRQVLFEFRTRVYFCF